MKKRIIFVNRYFWPDHSATSQLLTDLTSHLSEVENEIHVVCSRLNYSGGGGVLPESEFAHGAHIHRVWSTTFGRSNLFGRAFDYFSFYLSSFVKLLKLVRKNDVLVAKTDPPLISVFAALVAVFKSAKLVVWLQDVFPEIAKSLNVKIVAFSPVYNLLKFIRNWSLNKTSTIVVIGDAMRKRIRSELKDKKRIEVIHNWVIGDIKPITKSDNYLLKEWGLENKFVIGYSGNLGRAHDYESIFEAIALTQDEANLAFLFVGGGAGYDKLKSMVEEKQFENVLFKPYQPIDILSYSLSIPDVHLISLEEKLEGLIVPSKFYGVLASARPMIMIGDEAGTLGGIVKNERLGEVVPCGKGDILAKAIVSMKVSSAKWNEYACNCKQVYRKQFSKLVSKNKWRDLLVTLSNSQ